MELMTLLENLTVQKGSDLHLVVGEPPVFRVNGDLLRQELPALDAAGMEALLRPYLSAVEWERNEFGQQDVEKTLRHGGHRFRLNVFRERGHLAAAIRVGPERVPTLDELGVTLEDYGVVHKVTQLLRGLILVVGPTGSGKTTMISAMIEEINRTRAERILTIEDPIEYEFESKKSVITQRAIGEDAPNFPSALRSAMREDPDVVLIGEMRDLESMALALSLADTGHLVFTTLHPNTASEAVQRLIDVWPEQQRATMRRMVANNLQAVIAQRLLPRHEKSGRVPAFEILVAIPRIRRMIQEGQTDLSVAIEAGRSIGMRTMDDDLVRLAENGSISRDMAWMHLEDKGRLSNAE